jgi:LPXTG-site transpeptidase (sortase) family protein
MSEFTEIHRLLRLDGSANEAHIHGAPHGLPVSQQSDVHHSGGHAAEAVMHTVQSSIDISRINFRGLLIYPLIFLLAFAFFFIVLNFSSVWSQIEGWFSKPQAETILGVDSAAYYKWISNYFYAVGDSKLLEPANDLDKDGLSNQDEFIMRTNPIVADSDGDGFTDGIEVINTANPWGSGQMTKSQKQLAEKLNLILINNRLSYNVSQNHGVIAGSKISNYDLEKPGRLSIPRLKLQVPLVWSKDQADFDNDLTKGVIHYPGTAYPGEPGVIYVSGHSSDYIWKKDPMHDVFSKLNYLAPGDDVYIDVYGKDGKVYNFRYQVSGSNTYKPDDQGQFVDNNANVSKLNLSTCWPIGTQRDRLVVTAVQVAL